MNLRFIEFVWSLPLLIVLQLILFIVLDKHVKQDQWRFFIPFILITFGLLYSVLQIFVFGSGYSAIPYVLISFIFILLFIIDLVRMLCVKIKRSKNG